MATRTLVYEASRAGPDIGSFTPTNWTNWVQANIMVRKSRNAVRPFDKAGLFSIWDYKGKYEGKFWYKDTISAAMNT